MLAGNGQTTTGVQDRAVEPKLDGWRALRARRTQAGVARLDGRLRLPNEHPDLDVIDWATGANPTRRRSGTTGRLHDDHGPELTSDELEWLDSPRPRPADPGGAVSDLRRPQRRRRPPPRQGPAWLHEGVLAPSDRYVGVNLDATEGEPTVDGSAQPLSIVLEVLFGVDYAQRIFAAGHAIIDGAALGSTSP